MSEPGNKAYLLDMQEFAGFVMGYVQGKTERDFLSDRQLRCGGV